MFTDAVRDLADEASRTNERRMIILTGESETDCVDLATDVCSTWGIADTDLLLISENQHDGFDTVSFDETDRLLGRTLPGITYCAHQSLNPNVLAAALGTISGGGVFVLCCPPFETWKESIDTFMQTLIVPPYSQRDLLWFFRHRFINSVEQFRGIAIFDVDSDRVISAGLTNPAPRIPNEQTGGLDSYSSFSHTAVASCRTRDQQRALNALSSLVTSDTPVVLTADRGRGKSAVLGIAAAEYARMNHSVLVTAPQSRNVQSLFTHAEQILEAQPDLSYAHDQNEEKITVAGAGSLRYASPENAILESPDILFVDEAAGIGLPLLNQLLAVDHVAFATTTHGYEGTGQRFAVTFQPHLEDVRSGVKEVRLTEPIRYAASDPLEPWLYHTLLLNPSPAPTQLVQDATLDSIEYNELSSEELSENEPLLRQVVGLLTCAHYKTQPNDVVRLLDAPNLSVRALLHNGCVLAVALLAEEGSLDTDTRDAMYGGERIRGNVIPDLLTSQLRDETASSPAGLRIVRIATHSARRREGFGTFLLNSIRDEFTERVDWLGTSFSATPDLVSFWDANGYTSVHLSIRRNQTTGTHSVIMLQGLTDRGDELVSRHADWFTNRLLGLVTGAYKTITPDVLLSVIRSIDTTVKYELSKREHTYVAESIDGPGTYDHNPLPFRKLGINYFLTTNEPRLDTELERFIIVRLLQGRTWTESKEIVPYDSARQYNQTIPLVVENLLEILETA